MSFNTCLHWDFPGGPVLKTPHFQCRGHRFHPWSGNRLPSPQSFLVPLCNSSLLSPLSQATTDKLFVTEYFHFREFYITGTTQGILFYVWLLAFNIIILKIIHLIMCIDSLLLFKKNFFIEV